jgi:hypothetical protein
MPATVYSTPEGLDAPEFDAFMKGDGGFDGDAYFKACAEHCERVAAWCRENSGSKNDLVGKTISFPVADGRAEYMVYTTKPLALIHLPYVDGYQADPILLRGLRVTDVRDLVERSERLASLFSRQ